jgi:hypothetical protein
VTIEKTRVEMRKARMVKALRNGVRLEFSLRADERLNELIPAAEQAFDIALQQGELPDEIDIAGIVAQVLDTRGVLGA